MNQFLLDMPLARAINVLIGDANDLFGHHSNFEVLLELVDLLSVLLLAPDEPILAPLDVIFDLVVLVQDFVCFLDDLRKAFIPVTRLRIVQCIWIQVNLFHCRELEKQAC